MTYPHNIVIPTVLADVCQQTCVHCGVCTCTNRLLVEATPTAGVTVDTTDWEEKQPPYQLPEEEDSHDSGES